jgi:hypothetical protein
MGRDVTAGCKSDALKSSESRISRFLSRPSEGIVTGSILLKLLHRNKLGVKSVSDVANCEIRGVQ